MSYRSVLAVIGALVILGACGARTPAGSARGRHDDGGVPHDSTVDAYYSHETFPPLDFRVRDLPWPVRDIPYPHPDIWPFPDYGYPDFTRDFGPPDIAGPDFIIPGCLPVSIGAVSGLYRGKWNGSAIINGNGSPFQVSGTMQFTATQSPNKPPGLLDIKGTVNLQGIPVINSLALQGELNCRNLSMHIVSSGVAAKGDYSAQLDSLSPLGFNNGMFYLNVSFGPIFAEAKGNWSAYK